MKWEYKKAKENRKRKAKTVKNGSSIKMNI